ncbi:hypothetical protein HMPREF1391_00077 [Helicobacter pylori GAM100Ai]|uniref:Uncharacterized protein n=1 Tax=Helicobacter pylori GAM100Ai TaxID=1159019 RepID=A0AB72ZWX3_HELPX|nr:hypothetical protein HMPREF1391_00077 [Helicobacter pylori GAM100Ai]
MPKRQLKLSRIAGIFLHGISLKFKYNCKHRLGDLRFLFDGKFVEKIS